MYVRTRSHALEDLPDNDLIRRFKMGDDDALEVLLRRHSDDLYRFCRHLVANRQDAEDIFQESLTRAIDRVDSLQSGSAFRGWLFRIARNLSVDSFRSRRRICSLLDEEIAPLPVHVDGPHDDIEVGEEYRTAAQALAKLAESHQRVLVLREIEGLSYADIARRLRVSKSAVETLLFRARRRLREEYAKRDRTVPGWAVVVGLRALTARLAVPMLGGTHAAAKLALSTALLGGAAAVSIKNLPSTHLARPPAKAFARSGAHQRTLPGSVNPLSATRTISLGRRHEASISSGSLASKLAPRSLTTSRGTKHHLSRSARGRSGIRSSSAPSVPSTHGLALALSRPYAHQPVAVQHTHSTAPVNGTAGSTAMRGATASSALRSSSSKPTGSRPAVAKANAPHPIILSAATPGHQRGATLGPRGNAATRVTGKQSPGAPEHPTGNPSLPPAQANKALDKPSSSPAPVARQEPVSLPTQGAKPGNSQGQGQAGQKPTPSKNQGSKGKGK